MSRLKRERQLLLEGIYRDYEKTLSPDAWESQPPALLVKDMKGFSEFLNAPYVERGEIAPGYAASLFPDFVADWTRKQQLEIVQLLYPGEPDQDLEIALEKLEVATSVITCSDCKLKNQAGRALLGWKNICLHKRNTVSPHQYPCSTFEVNSVATTAAAAIVSCAGLNPETATIREMDTLNARFMCGNCLPETSRGMSGLKVYTWIECVNAFPVL